MSLTDFRIAECLGSSNVFGIDYRLSTNKGLSNALCWIFQILEHDKKPKWWVFRSWGRVGTTIGGTKLDSFDERLEATR